MCLVAVYFLHDQILSFNEGVILISLFVIVLGGMAWLSFNVEKGDPLVDENELEIPNGVSTSVAILWVILGLVMLPLSAHFLVESAVFIAKYFGISDLVIGLTIIALGTSLPELAACIAGVLKGEDDLAMGNIIGSNIFNILAVLGMPGLIAPGLIDADAATRDMYVMLGLTILLLIFSFNFKGTRRINRLEGAVLVAAFLGYQFILFA
jgi:cation:H+ antiporter